MINALALPSERTARREILQGYINSKLLPAHIRTVDQAEVIVGIGREIGLPPIASLRTITLINGVPTVSPAMMIALANQRGLIKELEVIKSEDGATVKITRTGRSQPHVESFTKLDADRLGLSSKDNYRKQPKVMYVWRAVSAAMRIVAPDVIFGLYTPEEMGASIALNPENELEGVVVPESPQMPSKSEARAIFEDIIRRLALENNGDEEKMGAMLKDLTLYQRPDTSQDFVRLAELETLVESHPKWLEKIRAKMDEKGIQVIGGISDKSFEVPADEETELGRNLDANQ